MVSDKKEYDKKYYSLNKEKVKERVRLWNKSHPHHKRNRTYEKTHKEEIAQRQREYHRKNKDKIRERIKSNPQRKIARKLRARIREAMKRKFIRTCSSGYKSGSAVGDLGCSISELKFYLESKFQDGMTWENYSLYGWHIDHIIPLAYFDLTDREQFLKACHYTNLQPLWAVDNLKKSHKITYTL
mgnify:CR=1 FL=1